jgi:hypothetical protein
MYEQADLDQTTRPKPDRGFCRMNLAVRRASLTDDREEIVELLNRNFEPGQEKRFEWRHLNHPAGPAWCWFVYDRDSGTTVATASVYPRRMFVAGKKLLCGQVGGFAVEAAYRSLGPAVLMQRTTFEPADSGLVAFCYDSPPHARGMSTFVRLGMQPNCEISRYVLPLRSDAFLEKKLGNAVWTKALIVATNLLLRAAGPNARPAMPGLEISEFEGAFSEEFSYLDCDPSTLNGVRATRAAEDLNWYYRENPGSDFRVLVARRAGGLLGYLTYLVYEERVLVVDVFCRQLASVGVALVDALLALARRDKRLLLGAYCSGGSELRVIFKSLGFRERERAAHVVAHEKSNGHAGKLLNTGVPWAFSQFDVLV